MTRKSDCVKEINIHALRKEDAVALDKLLSACAEAAVKETGRKVTAREKGGEICNKDIALELADEGLDVIYECYARSKFASPNSQHRQQVRDRLATELAAFLPTEKFECMSLVLPIMAYTLLVNNEYNPEAVRKRIRNDKSRKCEGSGCERNVWGHVDPFTIYRSVKPKKSADIQRLQNKLMKAYTNADDESLQKNPGVIDTFCLLADYETIIKLQDMGRIGSFLLEIVVESHDPSNPINTLLRLYLANRLDNILIRLINYPENIFSDNEEKVTLSNILLRYCELDESIAVTDEMPLEVELPVDLHAMEFIDLYHKLVDEFTITDDCLDDLIIFCWNYSRLEGMCELGDRSKDFVKAVIKDLNSCAQTTKRRADSDLASIAWCILGK